VTRTSLTETQASVLRILRAYMRDHGIAPTLDQLCELTMTKSAGSMHKMLNKLADKGFLGKRDGGWRQIRLKDVCPCCGQKMRTR
jgi:SOS-response transcriptional repressor LexA